MRIRWVRVAAAVVGAVGIVPAVVTAGMWLTSPQVAPVERSTPGPARCRANEVLEAGALLHAKGADGRLAADVLLEATRCAGVEELSHERLFEVYRLAEDGLDWIAANEDGEVALDHALDVWELAADQRWAGPVVNVAVWSALGSKVREIVEDRLFEVPRAARLEARDRLVELATGPSHWDEVAARDERSMWRITGTILTRPSAWVELPLMPWEIWQSRQRSHARLVELTSDHRTGRIEAAVLAGAADLSLDFDGRTCPDHLAVAADLRAAGIVLTLDPELCVVAGMHEWRIRMASPRPALRPAVVEGGE